MTPDEAIALLLTSASMAGLVLLSWLIRLKANGQLLRLRQFIDLLFLATLSVWITVVVYYSGVIDFVGILKIRKLSFWVIFSVAIYWLLAGILRKPAPLQAIPVAQIDMDIEGKITRWNHAATDLLGYTSEEALHQPVVDLIIPEKLKQDHQDGLMRYRKTREAPIIDYDLITVAQRKDKKIIEVSLLIRRHFSINGLVFSADIRPAPLRLP